VARVVLDVNVAKDGMRAPPSAQRQLERLLA
jgi:hypothetical protein